MRDNNVAERDGAPMNGQLKDLQHETIINLHGPQFIVVCTNLNNSHRNYVIYMKFLAASYTNLCDWHYFKSASEILKVGSAESTLLLFFCPCCANFWSVYAHRMCIGAYFWLQLC